MIELIIAVVSLVISSFHAAEAKRTRDDQRRFYENQNRIHRKIIECMGSMENLMQFQQSLQFKGDLLGVSKVQALLNEYNSEDKFLILNSYLQSQEFCREMKLRSREVEIWLEGRK